MKYSDEILMAYVDRELDAQTSNAIAAALAQDAELAARVERQRKLRLAVHAAYEPVLVEPMPQRLLDATRGAAASTAPSRSAARGTGALRTFFSPRRWSWFEWGAMAASVVLGVLAGGLFLGDLTRVPSVTETAANPVADPTGMFARGELARALSEQLASTQAPDAPIKVGLSFVSTADEYCRTFTFQGYGATSRLDGLACRGGAEWRLQLIVQEDRGGAASSEYRTAGTEVSPLVLRAVEDRILGSALDAAAERAAQQRRWLR